MKALSVGAAKTIELATQFVDAVLSHAEELRAHLWFSEAPQNSQFDTITLRSNVFSVYCYRREAEAVGRLAEFEELALLIQAQEAERMLESTRNHR